MYLTYEEYKAQGGTVPSESFDLAELKARSLVDYYTFGRITEPISDDVKGCIIELIEFGVDVKKASEEGSKVIQSERVGDHSVTYADGLGLLGIQTGANMGTSQERKEYNIIAKYLAKTGLLYRGV